MGSHADKLQRFKNAMKIVYGSYEEFGPNRASEWTPPESPGAGGHRGRYLWTDAFGVVNFITLSKETSSPFYLGLARKLVQTVHDVLGRTRDGSTRLPDATDQEPLKGGLRIGKMDETGPDGDGQYHHYLTLWMFALNRLALATNEPKYNDLAIQLAKAIHPRFMVRRGGRDSMVWKISMDMRRALVPSKGHLDDVTGLVVFQLLQSAAQQNGQDSPLEAEIEQYREMVARERPLYSSEDPLDLGMSLWISHFDKESQWSRELSDDGLDTARRVFLESSVVTKAASRGRRLAFRDFGACLGIKCYSNDESLLAGADTIAETWTPFLAESGPDLRPITFVMYGAALIPGAFREGYLDA